MAKLRKTFRDIFSEDKNEVLTLVCDVEVKGKNFPKGYTFTPKDELAGVNFHKYRYLDLAVEDIADSDRIRLVGFYPAK